MRGGGTTSEPVLAAALLDQARPFEQRTLHTSLGQSCSMLNHLMPSLSLSHSGSGRGELGEAQKP